MKKKTSLGFKTTAVMLCIIVSGIIITVGIATIISGNTIIRETTEKVSSETNHQAGEMDIWLLTHKATVNTTALALSQVNDYSDEHLFRILNAILVGNDLFQDTYIGFPNNTAVMGSGTDLTEVYAAGWKASERDWYKLALIDTSKVAVTDIYVDTGTGDLCITASRAVRRGNQILGVVGVDILINDLQDMVFESEDMFGADYAMLLNREGDIFIHPNNAYAPDVNGGIKNITTIANGSYAALWRQISAADDVYKFKSPIDGSQYYYISSTLESTGWIMVTVLPSSVVTQPIKSVIQVIIPVTIVILVAAALLIYLMVKNQISAPLIPPTAFFNKAGHTGDIALSEQDIKDIAKYSVRTDEIGQLIESAAAFVRRITEVSETLEMVANGDLTVDIVPLTDMDTLGLSMKKMTDSLNIMFGEINSASSQVTVGSKQVADGAQLLAQGSTEQATSIQELSSSIAEIAEKTKVNTNKAETAARLAGSIKESAEKSSDHMNDMMNAVNEINEASGSISKVIKVIDDIAFQTNILALNAAVEAARAGQHGKGFAVVAEEVRNLAAKSAEAAKDTSSMIENSIEKANLGVRIAGETSESLAEIVSGINESNLLVGDIAKSSEEQALGITQVNVGIDQVAQVVQQNSATAQESAAASEEMSAQSNLLQELVTQFKLKDGVVSYQSIQTSGKLNLEYDEVSSKGNNDSFGKY